MTRPRELCYPCYYTPGVMEQYPPVQSSFNNRGVGNVAASKPPQTPLTAPPGTVERLRQMEERAKRGEDLTTKDDPDSYDSCEAPPGGFRNLYDYGVDGELKDAVGRKAGVRRSFDFWTDGDETDPEPVEDDFDGDDSTD